MFLSDSMEQRLKGVDIRGNETVRRAYSSLYDTALAIRQQLPPPLTEDAQIFSWALEYALFLSGYVKELCLRYEDPVWLREQLDAFERFGSHVSVLSRWYTDFSMPSEYQSRIGIHQDYIRSFLSKNS